MFRNIFKYFSLISLLFFHTTASYPQSYFSRTFTEAEGLINSKVYDVVQDKNGLLWFSTLHGCSTFDGLEWTSYSYPLSQPHRLYIKLFADSTGTIWAVSEDLEIDYFDGEKWHKYRKLEKIHQQWGYVSDLEVFWRNGKRFIAVSTTNSGIYLCSDEGTTHPCSDKKLECSDIYGLDYFRETLIAATGSGLVYFKPDTTIFLPAAELNLPSDKIVGITIEEYLPDSASSGHNNYRLVLNGMDWFGVYENGSFQLLAEFPKLYIYDPYSYPNPVSDGAGGYFLGMTNAAYHYVPGEGLRRFGLNTGLITEGVSSICRDFEGNFWFAGGRGVTKFPHFKFENYSKYTGLLADEVSAIYQDRDGIFYFGHNQGLTLFDGKQFTKIPFAESGERSLNITRVMDIAEDQEGKIWIAASGLGVACFTENMNLKWFRFKDNNDSHAYSLEFDANNRLFVGANKGLFEIKEGVLKHITHRYDGHVRSLIIDDDNNWYYSIGRSGIVRCRGRDSSLIRAANPHEEDVFTIARIDEQTLLAGTSGGVMIVKNDSLVRYDLGHPMIYRPVYNIVKDSSGGLWLGTDNGVYRYQNREGVHYTIKHGLAGQETNRAAGIIDNEGKYWIGTSNGASRYIPGYDHEEELSYMPQVEILDIYFNDEEYSFSESELLPYNSDLFLHYRYCSFLEEGKVSYRVTLEAANGNWHKVVNTSSRETQFNSIKNGKYRIRIEARDGAGKWTEPAVSPIFQVKRPYYSQTWFILFALAILTVLSSLTHRYYVAWRYSDELTKEVRKQTRELGLSNERFISVLDGMDSMVYVADMDTYEILFANKMVKNRYGGVIGEKCWHGLKRSDHSPCDFCNNDRLIVDGRLSGSIEVSLFQDPDNGRWYESHSRAIEWTDGRMVRLEFFSDITDRKLSEEKIRESEAKYRQLAETANDIIIRTDLKGRIIYINRAGVELAGYSEEEFKHMSIEDIFPPGEHYKLKKRIQKRSAGESNVFRYEVEFKSKDGKTLYLDANSSLIIEQGKPGGILIIARDVTEKKISEGEIRESEKRYRGVVEIASEGIFSTDVNGNILYANPAALAMGGYTMKEIREKNYLDLVRPKYRRKLQIKYMRQFVKKETTTYLEYQYQTKKGDIIWVGQYSNLRYEAGEIAGYEVIARDITDRKRMEETKDVLLEISNSVYSSNNLNDLYIKIHYQLGRILDTTNFYIAMYKPGEEYINLSYCVDEIHVTKPFPARKTFTLYVINNDIALMVNEDQVKEMIAQGDVEMVETPSKIWMGVPLKTHDQVIGAIVLQSYTDPNAYNDKDLELLKFVSKQIATAIERKTYEQAIAESEEKYRLLIENSLDAIYLVVDGKFKIVNRRFAEMFGISAKDIIGADFSFTNLMDASSPEIITRRTEESGQSEQPEAQYEFKALLKNGRKIDVRATISYVPYEGELATQGIIRDLSEQRLLEEQLRHIQKQEAIGTLAGGIAHDFNNLLTGVLGNIELVLYGSDYNDKTREHLFQVKKSAERAAELTSQILAYGSHRLEKPEPLDLNECIEEAMQMIKRSVTPLIELEKNLSPDLYTVKADAGQMNQVFINIMINSVDAMEGSGKIIVTSSNMTIDEEYCEINNNAAPGEYAKIEISDNGKGISEENLSKIFDPFFTTKEIGKGTGLGLAVVYGIIKGHNGWIDVESDIGKGACFIVFLPKTEARIRKPERAGFISTGATAAGTETILLVDDEAVVRDLGKVTLETFGYKVILARDGVEGVEAFNRNMDEIALVILDLSMPRKSGKETLLEILAINPDAKILISSGYSHSSTAEEMMQAGAVDFLPKPYNIKVMIESVRKAIDGA